MTREWFFVELSNWERMINIQTIKMNLRLKKGNIHNIIFDVFLVSLILFLSFVATSYAGGKNLDKVKKKGYFFEMVEDDIINFSLRVNQIELGETRENILQLLGSPTFEQNLVRKDGKFVCKILTYYAKRWDENLVNEKHDKYIRLELNKEGHLIRIISNIDFIKNRQ